MQTTSLRDIEDLRTYLRNAENSDLFVINTSDLHGSRPRSECVMTIASEGEKVHVIVKDTFIPQNIGLRVSALRCYAVSEDFMRFIDLGFLRAIDADSALAYLKTNEARDELLRLSDLGEGVAQTKGRGNVDVSPKVVAIMMNDMDAPRKISAFKNIVAEITKDDIAYIVTEAKDERVKTWALSLSR